MTMNYLLEMFQMNLASPVNNSVIPTSQEEFRWRCEHLAMELDFGAVVLTAVLATVGLALFWSLKLAKGPSKNGNDKGTPITPVSIF